MYGNDAWDLVDLKKIFKPVDCIRIFKTNRDLRGNVERFEARLVVKGFTQSEGIDFNDTFATVTNKDSLRIIMTVVATLNLKLHNMDVKQPF